MDAFWSFWVILTRLVISGPNLVVFAKKLKKVNFATRRRQIHPTSLFNCFYFLLLGGFRENILLFFQM